MVTCHSSHSSCEGPLRLSCNPQDESDWPRSVQGSGIPHREKDRWKTRQGSRLGFSRNCKTQGPAACCCFSLRGRERRPFLSLEVTSSGSRSRRSVWLFVYNQNGEAYWPGQKREAGPQQNTHGFKLERGGQGGRCLQELLSCLLSRSCSSPFPSGHPVPHHVCVRSQAQKLRPPL